MQNLTLALKMSNLEAYERDVMLKYQIFNGLFLGLPFDDPDQAGARLPIFSKMCQEAMNDGKSAPEAVDYYLSLVPIGCERRLSLLLKFLQFIERQVVLFDSLEDAAFSNVNDMSGHGTVAYLLQQVQNDHNCYAKQLKKILENYQTRIVLTAHPTQFYPAAILEIIGNLGVAIRENDINEIRNLFLQMGLTRFTNQDKPTPVDEARSIIWYLENVFYNVLPQIQSQLPAEAVNLELGFWPGGDRDGNPYVTAKVTLDVADKLRTALRRLYYRDIQSLRHRLTFDQVHDQLGLIAQRIKQDGYGRASDLIKDLKGVVELLQHNYRGLFKELVEEVILKVTLFQLYFAKIDIRQNSAIHQQVVTSILRHGGLSDNYATLSEDAKIKLLEQSWGRAKLTAIPEYEELAVEVINTIRAVQTVQELNGMESIERYIISNTDSVSSILEVYG